MGKGHDAMKLIKETKRWAFWAQYDEGADVYEVFLDENGESYIGCCDDIAQALRLIEEWIAEQ